MTDKPKNNPSIVDVAEAAGVSAGTVSRVINANPKISAATVRRVISAMDDLGYSPPHPTRRRGKSSRAQQGIHNNQVAVVPLGVAEIASTSPVLTKTWQGVHRALDRADLAMVTVSVSDLARPPAILDPKRIDGAILQGQDDEEAMRGAFEQMPTVFVFSCPEHCAAWSDQVLPDDDAIGELAAEHLLGRDRRHLAFLNPGGRHPTFDRRGEAFVRAAKTAGASVEYFSLDVPGVPGADAHLDSLRARTARLIDQLLAAKPLPQGIFLASDLHAALVQAELLRRGIAPGADLSLVSCNNEEHILAGLHPRPATIDIRPDLVGDRAVDQLLWRMANRQKPPGGRITIPPKLVEGDA